MGWLIGVGGFVAGVLALRWLILFGCSEERPDP